MMFGLMKKLREKDEKIEWLWSEVQRLGDEKRALEASVKIADAQVLRLTEEREKDTKSLIATETKWCEKYSTLLNIHVSTLEKYEKLLKSRTITTENATDINVSRK